MPAEIRAVFLDLRNIKLEERAKFLHIGIGLFKCDICPKLPKHLGTNHDNDLRGNGANPARCRRDNGCKGNLKTPWHFQDEIIKCVECPMPVIDTVGCTMGIQGIPHAITVWHFGKWRASFLRVLVALYQAAETLHHRFLGIACQVIIKFDTIIKGIYVM